MNNLVDNPVNTLHEEKHSISAMAIKLNISRGKLYRLLQQSGQYDSFKASGESQPENNQILYTQSDWENILTDIGYAYPQPEQPTERPDETALGSCLVEFVDSAAVHTLDTPEIPQTFDLAIARQNLGLAPVTDNADLLNQADRALQTIQAMSAHLDSQWAQAEQGLRQSQQTAATVRRAAQGLQDKARRVEMRTAIATEMKALADSETQEHLAEVASLGKPAAPTGSVSEF